MVEGRGSDSILGYFIICLFYYHYYRKVFPEGGFLQTYSFLNVQLFSVNITYAYFT